MPNLGGGILVKKIRGGETGIARVTPAGRGPVLLILDSNKGPSR